MNKKVFTKRRCPTNYCIFIAELRGVLFSSIAFEFISTILGVFLRKYFECKKSNKRKSNNFHPLKSFCMCEKLLPLLFSVRLVQFCQLAFASNVLLCRPKIVLLTSNTILLKVSIKVNVFIQKNIICKTALYPHKFSFHVL